MPKKLRAFAKHQLVSSEAGSPSQLLAAHADCKPTPPACASWDSSFPLTPKQDTPFGPILLPGGRSEGHLQRILSEVQSSRNGYAVHTLAVKIENSITSVNSGVLLVSPLEGHPLWDLASIMPGLARSHLHYDFIFPGMQMAGSQKRKGPASGVDAV